MSTTFDGSTFSSLVASHENSLSQVSVKAVVIQLVLMSSISIGTILAFSFFRPREKKVYAPKIKYQLPAPSDPLEDPDYEPPPPPIPNGFFAWFSPVIRLKEEQMIANIGLDATTFLRFLRLLRNVFSLVSILGVALLVINIVYNKTHDDGSKNSMAILTIQYVQGGWMWPALGVSYIINFIVMYFVWRNWQSMVLLRRKWFRSPAYQTKIYSRTLMVTHIRKDYRSDEGLLALMGQLKVDGIKIGSEIDCTSIGRRLEDFPAMVEDHNQAVKDLEQYLVKYLKNGQMAKNRPTMTKGGFLGIGGEKKDAIDYYAKEIKFLRDKIDAKRQAIDSLLRQERKARKGGRPAPRIEGENYGFVTFKTIAEAHRIARAHRGKLKELFGAEVQLAPMPHDIVWENVALDDATVASKKTFGFLLIGLVCFLNTLPLLIVSILANLSALTLVVPFLAHWRDAGQWGNWTFSVVSGVLPSVISFLFGFFLPIIIRRISKYQGAPTRSRLDRAVTARYFFFIIVSSIFIFSLLGVFYSAIAEVVLQIGEHKSASEVLNGLKSLPGRIQGTYVQQSTYWLTWLPLRGFLVAFELIQLIKLAMVSLRRFVFSHTPRDIREMTKPAYFEYAIVIVNLLFVAAVGLLYAPLAPLVAIGACAVFWFSSVVYKYQLLYVYVSRAESGGRMWNVYCNRLIACCILMQLLMILTVALIRGQWIDCAAGAPPVILMIAFKIYISKTAEQRFRYYEPTPAEAEAERRASWSEKRTKHSDMQKRFLHPALQHDKLFQVMVHKSQESLAREVLSAYPWFADKHAGKSDGVLIKAVREENLEYDPERDGPRDEAHQAEWDARSIASTNILGGAKSERGGLDTPFEDPYAPGGDAYSHYPLPARRGSQSPFNSSVNLPIDNPSTDHLIGQTDRSADYQPRRQGSRGYPASAFRDDPVSASPLLDPYGGPIGMQHPPYPPSAYAQPPIGYTPPTLRRTATDQTDYSGGDEAAARAGRTQWDGATGDLGDREAGYPLPSPSGHNPYGYAPVQGGAGAGGHGPPRPESPYGPGYGGPYGGARGGQSGRGY